MAKKDLNEKLLKIISDIKDIKSFESFPYLKESLIDTEEEIKYNEFKITVVGEFSSGKSTFLNALIGKNILPHAVSETTATVTYIHNVSSSDVRCNTAIIHFRDNSEKRLDIGNDCSALEDYVTTSKNQFDVVKDIRSVDVYVHFTESEEPIVLIDTPGMNGIADGHRDITLHEIQHSHASICLFHIRGMGKSDLEFIKELMKYQQTVFFVLNAIDNLKDEEETPEERMQKFKDDIVYFIFSNHQQPEYVYGISALKALVARDKTIPRLYTNDQRDLTEEDRSRILVESNMIEFENALFGFLNNSEKDKKFYQAICQRLIQNLESIKKSAETDKSILEAKNEDIPEKIIIQGLIERADKNTEMFRGNLSNTVISMLDDFQKELFKMIREDVNNEHDRLIAHVNALTLEDAKGISERNYIGKQFNTFWDSQKVILSERMQKGVDDIQQSIVLEMQRTMPSISFKDKQFSIATSSEFVEFDDSPFQSRIQRLRSQKAEYEKKIKNITAGESAAELEKRLSVVENEENQLRNEYRASLRNLGVRPSIKYKQVDRIKYKTNLARKFGSFLGLCDEYKEVRWKETVPDDSARRRYDTEKSQIEREFSSSLKNKQREIDLLVSKVEQAQNNEAMRVIWQSKLDEALRKIKEEEEAMRSAELNSRTSFLKNLKKDYIEKIENQTDQLYADLTDGVRENLNRSKEPLLQGLYQIFDEKKREYVHKLQQMIAKIDGAENVAENNQMIQVLTSDITTINNTINQINQISYEL